MTGRNETNRHHGKGRYTAEQIRIVLASKGEALATLAERVGAGVSTVKQWRAGDLPQWFVDAEAAKACAREATRRSRFYKPDDARAAR